MFIEKFEKFQKKNKVAAAIGFSIFAVSGIFGFIKGSIDGYDYLKSKFSEPVYEATGWVEEYWRDGAVPQQGWRVLVPTGWAKSANDIGASWYSDEDPVVRFVVYSSDEAVPEHMDAFRRYSQNTWSIEQISELLEDVLSPNEEVIEITRFDVGGDLSDAKSRRIGSTWGYPAIRTKEVALLNEYATYWVYQMYTLTDRPLVARCDMPKKFIDKYEAVCLEFLRRANIFYSNWPP